MRHGNQRLCGMPAGGYHGITLFNQGDQAGIVKTAEGGWVCIAIFT